MTLPRITAAILAGGAGTRLGGRDKGLEPLDGLLLVEHVIGALRDVDAVLIVANRNHDAYACHARTIAWREIPYDLRLVLTAGWA